MTSRRPPAKPTPFGPRLTDDQREEILAAFRQGTSIIKLAAKYGVSKQAISLLAKRRGVKNETKALLPSAAEVTLMLYRCGLTPKEAGAYLRNITSRKPVDYRTVKTWMRGGRGPRWEQWQQLLELCERQDRAADEQLALVVEQAKGAAQFTIPVARSTQEAKRFGWPCAGAHLAVIRRVIERAPKGLRIVPIWATEAKRLSRSRRS